MCPWLCNFDASYSLFLDGDMLVLDDICKIFETDVLDEPCPVFVVKNPRRFEWPSLMLFHNASCEMLTPQFVENEANQLFDFAWAGGDFHVGTLPAEWNHCIGYDAPRTDAKVVHFTQGIPCHEETSDSEYYEEWHMECQSAFATCSWAELMAGSVHAKPVMERYAKRRQLLDAEQGLIH